MGAGVETTRNQLKTRNYLEKLHIWGSNNAAVWLRLVQSLLR